MIGKSARRLSGRIMLRKKIKHKKALVRMSQTHPKARALLA